MELREFCWITWLSHPSLYAYAEAGEVVFGCCGLRHLLSLAKAEGSAIHSKCRRYLRTQLSSREPCRERCRKDICVCSGHIGSAKRERQTSESRLTLQVSYYCGLIRLRLRNKNDRPKIQHIFLKINLVSHLFLRTDIWGSATCSFCISCMHCNHLDNMWQGVVLRLVAFVLVEVVPVRSIGKLVSSGFIKYPFPQYRIQRID